eukprot:657767-Rhodomonas_salina.4
MSASLCVLQATPFCSFRCIVSSADRVYMSVCLCECGQVHSIPNGSVPASLGWYNAGGSSRDMQCMMIRMMEMMMVPAMIDANKGASSQSSHDGMRT